MIRHQIIAVPENAGESLPSLVDRAAKTLANARGYAEVLEAAAEATFVYDLAKRVARIEKAKGAHDALIAAAHRAQADALLIESQAKRRLADEYDAAQERGEVSRLGDNLPSVQDVNSKPTASDLGLIRRDIYEARQIRDAEQADPGIIRRTVESALANGEEPTRAKLKKVVTENYISARAKADGERSQKAEEERQFRQFRKTWKSMSAGAKTLALAWLATQP